MAQFIITETVEYEIDDPEVETEEDAESVFLNADDTNAFFVAVTDRTVERVG